MRSISIRPALLFVLAAAFFTAHAATAADQAPPAGQPPVAKAKAPPRPLSDAASPARTKDKVEFVIGPDYAWAPEVTARPDVPKGQVHAFTMKSADSKFYPGIARGQPGVVPYEREVFVYVPSQYVAGTPAPFIVVHDGKGYSTYLPTILDNLIAAGRVPALIAVMVHHGGGDGRGS